MESAVAAINQGSVHKYLTKPWQAAGLRETLRSVVATLEIVRRDALSLQIAMRAEEQQAELETRFRGFTSVRRVDGAYLLHDVRTVESLSSLGDARRSCFKAASWLPDGDDRTQDLRNR